MHKISIQTLLVLVISFVLVSVFVPLSFIVINEENDINLLRQEQVGTALIPEVQHINILLAQHRGTANRLFNGNVNLQPALNKLEAQIDSAFSNSLIQCNAQSFELPCKKFVDLQIQWQTLKEDYPTLSTHDSFGQHSLLIADMMILLTDIADSSNLSLDDQLSTYYLMDNMVEKLPDLTERIGQLRGFTSGVLAHKPPATMEEQINIARLVYGVRLSLQAMNVQENKIFNVLPEFQTVQQKYLADINQKVEFFLSNVDKQVIQNHREATDEFFYNQASDVITQIMLLYTPVVESLNKKLDQRVESLLCKHYIIFTGAFFFLSLLIFFLFQFKKRLGVLSDSIECFEQFSIENYNPPPFIKIKYHDEIGRLLGVLNLMCRQLSGNVFQLKNTISRLTEAQRIAQLGDWNFNIQTYQLECSEETYRIFGITEKLTTWRFERFLARIKAADRQMVSAIFNHAQDVAGHYHVEYKTLCETKIIRQCIESHADSHNKIVRLVGTIQDVTLQREMEAKICLAAKVFEHVGEAIVVTDENNKVTLINNAFSEITGYSQKEVLGQNPNFLNSGKHDATFYKLFWDEIHATGGWKGEMWNQRKNGELYPEMLTITTMRNCDGEIVNHIGIFSDITEQKRTAEKIEYLANYDGLTGLMNRRALEFAAKQALANAKRHPQLLALLFIDLDGFKAVNDNFGHHVGDDVLKTTADSLKKTVRDCDMISRLGGDEFVVLLTNLTDLESISPIADKIVLALNQTLASESKTLYVTPSIGISVYSESCDDYEMLLTNADKAMYLAKTQGKNNYQFAAQD